MPYRLVAIPFVELTISPRIAAGSGAHRWGHLGGKKRCLGMVPKLLTDARETSYEIFSPLLTAECSTVELPGNRTTLVFSFYYSNSRQATTLRRRAECYFVFTEEAAGFELRRSTISGRFPSLRKLDGLSKVSLGGEMLWCDGLGNRRLR